MNKTTTGIYAIVNKINSKQYIGSARNATNRWQKEHLPALKNEKHYNRHLQNAWNKYGEDNFEFRVLEECDESLLVEREGHWIEHYKSWDRQHGYNLARYVKGRMVLSEETRQRMREANWQNEIPWPEFQEKVLDLYKQNISKNKIAKILKTTRNAVYTCLELNSLHKNEGKGSIIKLTPENKQKILELREKNLPWDAIFKETGIGKTQFYRAMKIKDGQYGGTHNKRTAYRTLTTEIEAKIIELHGQGKSWQAIADAVGVARETLYLNGWQKKLGTNKTKKTRGFVRIMTPDLIEKARELRSQGVTWTEIAKTLEVSVSTLRNYKHAAETAFQQK